MGIKEWFIYVIIFFSWFFVALLWASVSEHPALSYDAQVVAPNGIVSVAVASTETQKELGLSVRTYLKSDEGMWFPFVTDDKYGFWMKEMQFPIDIVWFDSSLHVVYAVEDVHPDSYPQVFRPEVSARNVLEVGPHRAKELGLVVGAQITLTPLPAAKK